MMKRILTVLLTVSLVAGCCGCSNKNENKVSNTETTQNTADTGDKKKVKDIVIEAEDAKIHGNVTIAKNRDDYSGAGYATNFLEAGDAVEFEVTVKEDGPYDLYFKANSSGDKKEMNVVVDDGVVGALTIQSNGFTENRLRSVWMDKGTHSIKFASGWGFVDLDMLTVRQVDVVSDDLYTNIDQEPCNPNATQETKNLYKYLLSIYGKKTLIGQHSEKLGMLGRDFVGIQKEIGKTPAYLELDFMEYSASRIFDGEIPDTVVPEAKAFAEKGGIVAISWHWNAPSKYLYNTTEKPWYSGFYAENTFIDLERIVYGEDEEGYNLLLADIDVIAEELKKLQDAKIPVIFRPLHEASGGWFWWGAKGAIPCKELYYILYDRLTNYHQLNNILWMWNSDIAEWYPGDNCVDIVSADIYAESHEYSTQANTFYRMHASSGQKKMIALSECGVLIDPKRMEQENVQWLAMSTWCGYLVGDGKVIKLMEDYTELDMTKKVYNAENVITLEELPDWKNGKFE